MSGATIVPAGFYLHPEAVAPMPVVTLPIDPLAAARRILSAPDAVYSATPFEIVAFAACTVRESSGTMPELPVIADRPSQSASLAAAVALFLRAADQFPEAVGGEIADALSALQNRFEKEFPNGSDL